MLLQSHDGEIHFLSALPAAWGEGSVRGLRARGGVEVEIAWSDGKAREAVLRAEHAGERRLRAPERQQIDGPDVVQLAAGKAYRVKFADA
jgi:alpha-L-fucosidase 2